MAKVAYKIRKVTFDELKQLFIKHCEKLGLFTHSQTFGYEAKDAFDTYRDCWGKFLIREGTITRQTFARWKRRGWIDEDMRNNFMTYCFGNRWRK